MKKHEIALNYIEQAVNILNAEYEAWYPHNMGDS